MHHVTIPDLTKSPPRQGRHLLGGRYAWLARLTDKVRAEHAGMNGDYTGYCPLSKAYLECIGVSEQSFDALIDQGASDYEIVRYFDEHVPAERRERANRLVLEQKACELEKQDNEEAYSSVG
jgi:hypothetical protein